MEVHGAGGIDDVRDGVGLGPPEMDDTARAPIPGVVEVEPLEVADVQIGRRDVRREGHQRPDRRRDGEVGDRREDATVDRTGIAVRRTGVEPERGLAITHALQIDTEQISSGRWRDIAGADELEE